MSKSFKDEHMLKLKGKDYLPVAPRVVMFRKDHPSATITTDTKQVGEDWYVFAAVAVDGNLLATAHKRVRHGNRGPAGDFPVETAETGAVGRALALCGYGTLSGDLDEGEEIADAPVDRGEAATAPDLQDVLQDVAAADPQADEWDVLKREWRVIAQRLSKTDRATLVKAVKAKEANA